MYDDHEPWLTGPDAYHSPPLDRLTHLVLVDGRLVDMWSEPVHGSRWEPVARRFDEELRLRTEPPPPPLPPLHLQVLEWLEAVAGSRRALDALDTVPLPPVDVSPPSGAVPGVAERFNAVARLLTAVAEQLFDEEVLAALLRALEVVAERDPERLVRAASAAHVAGGICWAVGKANGLYRAGGVRQLQVQRALALRSAISSSGPDIARVLRGLRHWAPRPWQCPDLEELGDPRLLIARTRADVVRLRDQARQTELEQAA